MYHTFYYEVDDEVEVLGGDDDELDDIYAKKMLFLADAIL